MTNQDDTKAFFSQGIEENMDSLYRTALRLTGSGADAEDLVAESVSKAWAAFGSLEDRDRFRPWVFRILHNTYISAHRKRAVRPVESAYHEDSEEALATLLNEQPDEFLVWWANPERQFFSEVLSETIMAAIAGLPDEFRMAIVLINVEGLKYDEAAEALGVPTGTVRSRMKRGRTLLQKALWQQARDAGLTGASHSSGEIQ